MRLSVKHCLVGLAALVMTMPVWARTYKQSMTVDKETAMGSTQLKPGAYDLSADDSKKELSVMQNGKVVATVQGQWVKLPAKPQYSTVVSDGSKITQVQFGGSDQAFQP